MIITGPVVQCEGPENPMPARLQNPRRAQRGPEAAMKPSNFHPTRGAPGGD